MYLKILDVATSIHGSKNEKMYLNIFAKGISIPGFQTQIFI